MKLDKLIKSLHALYCTMRKQFAMLANIVMLLTGFTTVGLLVYDFGYRPQSAGFHEIHIWVTSLMWIFLIAYSLRILSKGKEKKENKGKWMEFILMGILLISVLTNAFFDNKILLNIFHHQALIYSVLFIISVIEISRWSFYVLGQKLNPSLIFVISFLFIIFIGAFLLMLPNATVSDGPMPFIDALFTSTSAVCVTGLIVVDTATYFTPLGQIFVIILIQIGGIGIMTFTTFIALFFTSKSSFHNRMAVRDLISGDNLNNIFRVLASIVVVTFCIELIGATIIYGTIKGTLGLSPLREMAFAAFHSVSAFCNAGFSTLSGNLADPLVNTNYNLHTSIAVLIVFGGIGFPILFNYGKLFSVFVKNSIGILLGRQKAYLHTKVISVNTRLAIITTACLLVIGTVFYFFLEYNNTLDGLSFMQKLSVSFFNSVTPRTAGFNNVDLTTCLHSTLFVTIILMWIGASPMSTGGGIKTTTFAIMILNLVNTLRGGNKIEVAKRQIRDESVSRAHAVITLSLIWLGISIFLLSVFEPRADLLTIIYECVSAISTVGLSLNFSPLLSIPGKVVIIVSMFVGRVGLFTILIGLVHKLNPKRYNYPDESVMT